MSRCTCRGPHAPRRIVLTGGPGAGKTAALELIRQALCRHVHVLPESAGIVFGGGFPRSATRAVRRAAQRAIFHVQRELEATTIDGDFTVVLCDRGTLDGLAYWPGDDDMLAGVGTTHATELARYHAVIHLRTPIDAYTRDNPLRVETAREAAAIDAKIATVWAGHPRRFEVPVTADFMTKVERVVAILRDELPACCRAAA